MEVIIKFGIDITPGMGFDGVQVVLSPKIDKECLRIDNSLEESVKLLR